MKDRVSHDYYMLKIWIFLGDLYYYLYSVDRETEVKKPS